MTKLTLYQSDDGRSFNSEEDCLNYERRRREWQRRINELIQWPDAEFEKLVEDLKAAKDGAYNPNIVDTMGTPQARAVFYMKGVCERFVEKHKELRMI